MLIEQIIELKGPLNTCEMRSNGIKTAFFSKNYEKSPGGWGLRPQTPVCNKF